MVRKKFKLWHSIIGIIAVVALQALVEYLSPVGAVAWLVIGVSTLGSLAIIYVATEVIEEVQGARYMLLLLSTVAIEFVVFFAFEYWFMVTLSPESFPTLQPEVTTILLHSIMVFVFNPLYVPGTMLGRLLLIINTASALGLVLFILQNIWQIRRPAR